MDARQSSKIKRISKQQEKQTAKDIGGRTQAASGATRLGGGADVRLQGKYRVECKFTNKDKYTLKLTELEKLRKQANSTLEQPIFQFCIKSHLGKLDRRYAVVPVITEKPNTGINIHAGSYTFSKIFLEGISIGEQVALTFFTKSAVREYKLMLWDDLIDSINQESNA